MSFSDSMFLFEIVVEEITSFIECQEFNITSQFADLFTLNLKEPHELQVAIPKRTRKKIKRKSKVRDSKAKLIKANLSDELNPGRKIRTGQSILIANNVESLKANMKAYPLQLVIWHKVDHQRVMGSTNIPWSTAYIAYLDDLIKQKDVPPVTVEGNYNVFDELYSKRMASVKMSIKLSCFKEKVTTQFKSLSDDGSSFMYTEFNSKPTTILSTIKEKKVVKHDVAIDATNDTGKIKTIYSGGKTKFQRSSREKNKNPKATTNPNQSRTIPLKKTKTNLNRSTATAEPGPPVIKKEPTEPQKIENERSDKTSNKKIIDLVKSNTDLKVTQKVSIIKSKSYSSLDESHLNTLNYIFGDGKGPFGNQVYCVGYFTIHKDTPSKSSVNISSKQSKEKMEKFKFRLCASDCPVQKGTSGSRSVSHYSIDVPHNAVDLIKVTKCDHVECEGKKYREPPTPPDDRILIDLSGLKENCCHVTEKVENVVGGMTAKMQVGKDPCYCTCECRFGFTKKTTYCKICGGYEISGDELSRKPADDMPFPCPIFHKLIEKRGKSTSSDSKKSRRKSLIDKGGESEKDGKIGKKKDDRFKFNYGYQAPQIGHSQCAMPCSGTLGNVPKHMGWLWTAEDVPGLKEVAKGWRPGAISRRLLRKLNMAKLQRYTVLHRKPLKKLKKRAESKPTLIICKVNGEYRVEMQVSQENSEGNQEQCTPLVYKIAKANNQDKVSKLERKKRRLIKKAVGEVWDDPYHPEYCERTCLRAYKQAVGLLPYDPNKPECTCSDYVRQEPEESSSCSCEDDDVSSDCSSMEVDWEIHFTPPSAYHS